MIDPLLNSRLRPLLRRLRQVRLSVGLALCWLALAGLGAAFVLLQRKTGWASVFTLPVLVLVALAAGLWTLRRLRRSRPDLHQLADRIERRHPELNGVLLTAVQQDEAVPGGLNFLQQRVVLSALQQSHVGRWRQVVPWWRVAAAHAGHLAALALLVAVLWSLRTPGTNARTLFTTRSGLEVTPGNITLERGSSLVVLARFGSGVPASAELVVAAAGEPERRLPLTRSLADPVFGGSVPDVASDLTYRVEYGGRRSGDFKVTVFEFPRLERANAELTFPAYTGQPLKRIEDTRRVSAVEGSRVDFALQLNKPVASARLVGRTNRAMVLPLSLETNRAAVSLRGFTLTNSASYDLQLVDADGRTNKLPATFVFEALPNRTPELKLASPRGDVRPSALEEIRFTGTVWDDFGVPTYGFAYTAAGGETKFVELGKTVPGQEKKPFEHLLRLEELGVQPDELVSWYVWADDIGPDGQVRRTTGDLFFAEVRPFEEIFREGQGMEGGESQGQAPQGTPATKLAELQKQIINATWKLQRTPGPAKKYPQDAEVVRDAQAKALEQAEGLKEEANDPRTEGLWSAVTKEMDRALAQLTEATNSPAVLPAALTAERAAYQALLKLQAREYSVSRSQSRGAGQPGQQANQRQLDQLDLKQSENRYETQRQAQAPQSAEQREQLQVLNRLQELARRQEDLNERMKELQTALQEAKTEREREEARRQLKRLEEQQRQMLADVDELRQRMDRPENQSQMAEERERLDQTRNEVQRAAEAARDGSTAQALAAGTRAQRELQELRDDLRKESSSQFAEDLRTLRSEARELAQQQEDIGRKLDGLAQPQRRTLGESPERKELAEQLARQRERMTNLVSQATQVSQLAENSEPLLAQKLYDTLRRLDQDDGGAVKQLQQQLAERGQLTRSLYDRLQETAESGGGKALDLTAELLRQGNLAAADQAEQRARTGIDQLKQGVERAAESVLGDDAEALRRAGEELDSLTQQLQRELAQADGANPAGGGQPGEPQPGQSQSGQPQPGGTQPGQASSPSAENPGQRSPGSTPGEGQRSPGQSPGEQPGDASAQASSRSPGQTPAPGQNGTQPGQAGQGGQGSQPGQQGQAGQPGQARRPGQPGQPGQPNQPGQPGQPGGGGRAGANLEQLAGGGSEGGGDGGGGGGPLTGGDFAPWSDRLREVEELVDTPELRAGVAGARERARLMRLEFRRDLKKPDWAAVQLEVVRPLVEVRQRIAEELARRGSKDALVPIDRDPVPNRYTELVRRYYEDLGKDK